MISSNGGWGIFNAILGWQNSATIGSVVSYCVYWIFVTITLIIMRIDERRIAMGKATLWRTLLRKGHKDPPPHGVADVLDDAEVAGPDDAIKNTPAVGVERDLQILVV